MIPDGVLLPDCRPRVRTKVTRLGSLNWTPIFCANCGKDGGMVPEEHCNFAFYLCQPCADVWSDMVGTMVVPDEVFWKNVHNEQIEKYGRILEDHELVEILKDDSHPLTKLCKDRLNFATRT